MQPMHLWRHSQAPCSSLSLVIIIIIIIPPSLPLRSPSLRSPPFLPLERVSLSNSTDAHTWRDRMRHCLTQTDAHSWRREVLGFFCLRMCTQLASHLWWYTHTHSSRHMPPHKLFTNHSSPLVYLWLHHSSTWCKTPYIGIPVWELGLKQPPVYSQPPFRKIREGRAGSKERVRGC